MSIRDDSPAAPLFPGPRHRWAAACMLATTILLASPPAPADQTQPLGVPGATGGVVATSEPAAARAGAEILRRGGNAVDAASAVMFALNVVEPQSAGIGGGGFMLIHLADSGETVLVDSRETAPAAATPYMFDGQLFPVASTSGIAVGVPGAIRGVELALQRWGSMDFAAVLEPAIRLAEEGFRVSRRLEESIKSPRLDTEPGNPAYEEARGVFRPDGEGLRAGQTLVQPDLARTLRTLAASGPDAFYAGPIAEAIVETQKTARHENPDLAGRMTLEDLAGYEARLRDPVSGDYRGYRIVSTPSPSSGGLTAIGVLKMLERFPVHDSEAGFGLGSTRTLHVMIEAMRLAFADRGMWMGDADHVDVPADGLLHRDYIAGRSALIDPEARLDEVAADDPRPYDEGMDATAATLAGSITNAHDSAGTTHFSVVDRHGNLVSYTNTIEAAWGTGLMVPGHGFLLNNELTDFNFTPRRSDDPSAYDPGANDVAAGKRPRSSMAPSMIFRDDQPLAAFGSPGGATIINTVVNVAMGLVDHGRSAQEAADLPRISKTTDRWPTSWEAGFDESVLDGLRQMGHDLRDDPVELGAAQIVVIDPETGLQFGAADRRRGGSVVSLGRDEIEVE